MELFQALSEFWDALGYVCPLTHSEKARSLGGPSQSSEDTAAGTHLPKPSGAIVKNSEVLVRPAVTYVLVSLL